MNFDVKRLRLRCEQSIEDIIGDASKLGDTLRIDTPDGPLVWVRRGAPVLGCVHLDWVDVPHRWGYDRKRGRVYTPRLDDRAGVFILLDVLPAMGIHLDLLLTDNEETGRSTAKRFISWCDSVGGPGRPTSYNWLAQFDRRGKDAVCYDYRHSSEWVDALKLAGFEVGWGSFSDIAALYDLGRCGVNVGVGYHHEHSTRCYGDLAEMAHNLDIFHRFYETMKDRAFPFSAGMRPTYDGWSGGGWHGADDYDGIGYRVAPRVRYYRSARSSNHSQPSADGCEVCANCGDYVHWRDIGGKFCRECEWFLTLRELDKRSNGHDDGFFD